MSPSPPTTITDDDDGGRDIDGDDVCDADDCGGEDADDSNGVEGGRALRLTARRPPSGAPAPPGKPLAAPHRPLHPHAASPIPHPGIAS